MTTATEKELSRLTLRDGQVTFDAVQRRAVIDALGVHHATDADLDVFFHQAKRTGLDPFLKQLYMIARKTWNPETKTSDWKQTFQTGIDGFRVVAHRRAKQLGVQLTYEDTLYYDDEGREHVIWVKDAPPAAVRVVVLLGNQRFPFNAKYTDFVQTVDEYEDVLDEEGKPVKKNGNVQRVKTGRKVPTQMWQIRPTGQLEKCAEASALRRACPQDLSGIYEFTEMGTDEVSLTTMVEARTVERPSTGRDWVAEFKASKSPEEINEVWRACSEAGELGTTQREAASEWIAAWRAAHPEPSVSRETKPEGEGAEPPADGAGSAADPEAQPEPPQDGDGPAEARDGGEASDPWNTPAEPPTEGVDE